MFVALSPDGEQIAVVGRGITSIYTTDNQQVILQLAGHESTVYRAIFSSNGQQLATVSADSTVRLWDVSSGNTQWNLRLPSVRGVAGAVSLWDFDFRCTPTGCWIAVPLTRGKLALYNLGPVVE